MESFLIVLLNNYFAVLKKYMVFTGRSSRKEFWFFVLVNVVVGIVFNILTKIPILKILFWIAYFLFGLAILIPSITVGIRRLHDTNRTGWLMLLCLVPFVGAIAVLVLCALEGTPGENQYGSVPSENAVM
jgi:uncharacterized membrane protein YhaH (DUF805 family)